MLDLHTHHERCGHAIGRVEDYINEAINKGINILGISDHSPFFQSEENHPLPKVAMPKDEFENYIKEVNELKYKYRNKIEVLLGIESDFTPTSYQSNIKKYQSYPFDYIIGSVHMIKGKVIFDEDRWLNLSEESILNELTIYYQLVQKLVLTGCYDILGHIDAIKGNFPQLSKYKLDIIEQTVRLLGNQSIVLEINTSGSTKKCGGWYPSIDILEMAKFYDVNITFGSDAHIPARIGEDWDEVKKVLKELGYSRLAFFRNRKINFLPI